jgi:hypothetical protein
MIESRACTPVAGSAVAEVGAEAEAWTKSFPSSGAMLVSTTGRKEKQCRRMGISRAMCQQTQRTQRTVAEDAGGLGLLHEYCRRLAPRMATASAARRLLSAAVVGVRGPLGRLSVEDEGEDTNSATKSTR